VRRATSISYHNWSIRATSHLNVQAAALRSINIFIATTEKNVLVKSTRDIIRTKYSDRTNRTSGYHD